MTADELTAIAGVALSLVFSYIPGVNSWWETLESQYKQTAMGILLFVVAGGVFALSCGGLVDVGIACDKAGALGLVALYIEALIANQAAYLITRK